MSTPRPVTDDDLTVLRLIHAALRRDLARLTAAADHPVLDQQTLTALGQQSDAFARQLRDHHEAEDRLVWPLVRERAGAPAEAVLASMEAEHASIDPALADVETALAAPAADELRAALAHLRHLLEAHLAHEEADAIPLVCRHLTGADLDHVAAVQRRQGGLRGARAFLPWILDQAPATDRDHVLRELPPLVRLLVRDGNASTTPRAGRAARSCLTRARGTCRDQHRPYRRRCVESATDACDDDGGRAGPGVPRHPRKMRCSRGEVRPSTRWPLRSASDEAVTHATGSKPTTANDARRMADQHTADGPDRTTTGN